MFNKKSNYCTLSNRIIYLKSYLKQREVLSMARLIGSENPIVCVQVGDNPDKVYLSILFFF